MQRNNSIMALYSEIIDSSKLTQNEQLELYKARGLNKLLENRLSEFKEKFEKLKLLENEPPNDENFETAVWIFFDIFDVLPLMFNQLEGSDIFRAQCNGPDELFTNQSRISYNKDNPKSINPGKFNVYYDAVFYGCVPYRPDKLRGYIEPYIVACYETCKALQDQTKQVLIQDFTIGQWKPKSAFNVINLCFDEHHLTLNPELRSANGRWLELLKDTLSLDAHQFIKDIFNYYSILCRTGSNEKTYYILTALFHAIRIYYGEDNIEINGLISSSAASNGVGLNIVLTAAAVDKFLYLNAVFMYRFFRVTNGSSFYVKYPCSEIIYNESKIPDFEYRFTEYLRPSSSFISRQFSKN